MSNESPTARSVERELTSVPTLTFVLVVTGSILVVLAVINLVYLNTIGELAYIFIVLGLTLIIFGTWMFRRVHLNLRYP